MTISLVSLRIIFDKVNKIEQSKQITQNEVKQKEVFLCSHVDLKTFCVKHMQKVYNNVT